METRRLGSSDLQVPPITLGGNVYGWTLQEEDSFRQLDRAVEAGLNFVDTADVYSRWVPGHKGGESETILGKWFEKSGKRNKVLLATKAGIEMGEGKKGLGARYLHQAIEDSLKRLRTDYIDLYQAHTDDAETPLDETLKAFDDLVKQGKVRFIGASNYKGPRLAEAIEASRKSGLVAYISLQPHYNLLEREPFESELLPVVQKYGLGVIPYFSLASGFLTGKYKNKEDAANRARTGMVQKYLNDRGFALVRELEAIAKELRSTAGRLALAWLIAQPGVTSAIASATNDQQLTDLIEATKLRLNADAIARLNRVSAPEPASTSA